VCIQVLIESKADVEAADDEGDTPIHTAAGDENLKCLCLLLDACAEVNARANDGFTPAMDACLEDRLANLQLLVDAEADLSMADNNGLDCARASMTLPANELTHRVPGMPFAVLSCNTNIKNVIIDDEDEVTTAIVDTHTNEYKQIQTFIDAWHSITKHALNEDVVVDKRVGRRGNGMYDEPLEQVLLYLGLSMKKNQTVNASIVGKSGARRALMPGHTPPTPTCGSSCASAPTAPAAAPGRRSSRSARVTLRATATTTANASTGRHTIPVTKQPWPRRRRAHHLNATSRSFKLKNTYTIFNKFKLSLLCGSDLVQAVDRCASAVHRPKENMPGAWRECACMCRLQQQQLGVLLLLVPVCVCVCMCVPLPRTGREFSR
jgi:hypothetical protein